MSLADNQLHNEFRQNALGNGNLHEGIISAIQSPNDPEPNQSKFLVVKDARPGTGAEDRIIFGTTRDDQLLQSINPLSPYFLYRLGNNSFYGDQGNDQIVGGSGNDRLYGGQGNDRLYGNELVINLSGGDDRLYGEEGNDELDGRVGNDRLYGGRGNDQLYGRLGNDILDGVVRDGDVPTSAMPEVTEIDTLTGGLGSDTFILGNASRHYYTGGGNNDYALITDFTSGQLQGPDQIQLKGSASDYILAPSPAGLPQGTGIYRGPSQLDLFLLEDLSGSFGDDIATVQSLVPDLVNNLLAIQPATQFGVGSFVDKPVSPFGYGGGYGFEAITALTATSDSSNFGNGPSPGGGSDGFEAITDLTATSDGYDYVYSTDLPLTSDTGLLQSTVNGLSIRWGDDTPEAQLEALLQTAVRANEIGFRDNAAHIVVLSTDAEFHVAGDGIQAGITTPNNGDAILDGNPPGTGEDFPTITQVRDALLNADIVPVFAVTEDVNSYYTDLVAQLGVGTVVNLSSDSSNLIDAITTGLNNTGFNNNELIGIAQGASGLNLGSSSFTYV